MVPLLCPFSSPLLERRLSNVAEKKIKIAPFQFHTWRKYVDLLLLRIYRVSRNKLHHFLLALFCRKCSHLNPDEIASNMSSLYPEMRFSWEIKSVDALFCNGMSKVGDLSREAILQVCTFQF